ncbi:hypothetical protein predicted by Glimmer/Critica [Erwinia amylovora CFBP1430]|uniref:Uncharacterized protein n=1 Tax=Erwinia amylovora (strain CFBP1430) TaxID=665029 RepID=D4HYE7_ERWAC|nr:hypothetical protein predicted by Glimmer/Critica [Erwinia amylovora CFBP1430]CCO83273.1 hypothetical protein BN433_2714 [Erwinia amylovora Ea266]
MKRGIAAKNTFANQAPSEDSAAKAKKNGTLTSPVIDVPSPHYRVRLAYA